MPSCVFDNPSTWHRECYTDKGLYTSCSFFLISNEEDSALFFEYNPFFFGANVGRIRMGTVFGDIEALPQELKQYVTKVTELARIA